MNCFVLFNTYGNSSLDSADNPTEAFCELGFLFFNFFTFFILFMRNQDVLDVALLSNSVNMENTLVTFGEDWLVTQQLKNLNFCFKQFCNRDLSISVTDTISFIYCFFILNSNESQLNILSRLCISDTLILAIVDCRNLARLSRRIQRELISHANSTRLNLSKNHCTSIFHFIQYGDS